MIRILARGALCAAIIAVSLPTRAEIGISPPRVALTPERAVETINVHNKGPEPIDFEVTVYSWTMDAAGTWKLSELPADENLIVYPLGFAVMPGKFQTIRVGVPDAARMGPERPYRIIIKQLPPAVRPDTDRPGLRVLNHFSIPVFAGQGGATRATIEPGHIVDRRWTFRLHASGNGHLDPAKARLTLRDASGRLVHEQPVETGYVLAGAVLPVDIVLPSAACRAAVSFEFAGSGPLGIQQGRLPARNQAACAD